MKLKCVLLIDDDHTTNVFHTVVLRRSQIADQILSIETPEIALDHLRKASKLGFQSFGQMPMPELMFLDVNMPRMGGFDFLTEFDKIYVGINIKCFVYMLTAVKNREYEKFLQFKCVKGILEKPLTREVLREIVDANFSADD